MRHILSLGIRAARLTAMEQYAIYIMGMYHAITLDCCSSDLYDAIIDEFARIHNVLYPID